MKLDIRHIATSGLCNLLTYRTCVMCVVRPTTIIITMFERNMPISS